MHHVSFANTKYLLICCRRQMHITIQKVTNLGITDLGAAKKIKVGNYS